MCSRQSEEEAGESVWEGKGTEAGKADRATMHLLHPVFRWLADAGVRPDIQGPVTLLSPSVHHRDSSSSDRFYYSVLGDE